jgi:Stress responsive A/B Barrel Domain
MVHHMVCLKFGQETTQNQKAEAIRRLQELSTKVPDVLALSCNHNFGLRSQGYDVGLLVQFEQKAHLDAYGPHPAHQSVVQYMKEIGLVDTLVVDFEQ